MPGIVDGRLKELGIKIPTPAAPAAKNTGAKCSSRGCEARAPGALVHCAKADPRSSGGPSTTLVNQVSNAVDARSSAIPGARKPFIL